MALTHITIGKQITELKAQKDATQASYDEVTQAIGDSQDKQSEFLGTAQEAEEQKVKDRYFKLIELAKQQGRSKNDIQVLEIQRENELNDIRLTNQQKQYDADKKIEEAIEIGFNVGYLMDVLANMSQDMVSIELSDGNSSALFTIPDNATFKYVVMPMRI